MFYFKLQLYKTSSPWQIDRWIYKFSARLHYTRNLCSKCFYLCFFFIKLPAEVIALDCISIEQKQQNPQSVFVISFWKLVWADMMQNLDDYWGWILWSNQSACILSLSLSLLQISIFWLMVFAQLTGGPEVEIDEL